MNAGPVRLLLVEDEPLVRMFVLEELEEVGFSVDEAANASGAIERLRAAGDAIAAAIIDVGLPDRRGDLLAGDMRALRADLPIVIASGYDETSLKAQFASDPRIAVLGKPYEIDRLRAVLEEFGITVSV